MPKSACDEGMRVIAAPERDVKCARDDTIGRERSQHPRILDALDARADVLVPQPKADIRAFDPECSFATVSHRSRPLSSGCPIAHRRDRRSRWCRSPVLSLASSKGPFLTGAELSVEGGGSRRFDQRGLARPAPSRGFFTAPRA